MACTAIAHCSITTLHNSDPVANRQLPVCHTICNWFVHLPGWRCKLSATPVLGTRPSPSTTARHRAKPRPCALLQSPNIRSYLLLPSAYPAAASRGLEQRWQRDTAAASCTILLRPWPRHHTDAKNAIQLHIEGCQSHYSTQLASCKDQRLSYTTLFMRGMHDTDLLRMQSHEYQHSRSESRP